MIAVYNETSSKWKFETEFKAAKGKKPSSLSGVFIRTHLSRLTQHGVTQGEYAEIVLPISNFPINGIHRKKLPKSVKADKRRKPVTISYEDVSTILTKKGMKRAVIPMKNDKYKQSLLLLTLDKSFIAGKIRVEYNKSLILDVYDVEDEFSAVVSFANYNDTITLKYKKKDGSFEKKIFRFEKIGNEEFINVEVVASTEVDYATGFEKIKPFVPFISSHAVLVYEKDADKLKGIKGQHDIYKYRDMKTIKEVIRKLKKDQYDAVTLFVDTKFREETDADRTKYMNYLALLKREFNVVIKYHNNHMIDRVQYYN